MSCVHSFSLVTLSYLVITWWLLRMARLSQKKAVPYFVFLMHSARWFSGCCLLCSLSLTRSTVQEAEGRRPCSSRPTESGQGTSWWFRARLEGDKGSKTSRRQTPFPDLQTNKKQHLKIKPWADDTACKSLTVQFSCISIGERRWASWRCVCVQTQGKRCIWA